jgi:hypothetical protein
MNTAYRPPSIKPAAFAFLAAFLFFSALIFIAQNCSAGAVCDALTVQPRESAITFTQPQVTYDSRIFLQPLQHILQAFLYLIPFFHSGNIATLFLTLIFAALVCGLIIQAAQHAGLKLLVGLFFVLLFLSSPIVIRSTLSGSGVSILIFLLGLAFLHLMTWQDNRFWLALVWIGLGAALAVLAQFTALFFLLLPVLAALIIAFREMPQNVYYAENALWIMLTPLLYVFLVRFFFGYALTGDALAFYRIESGLIQAQAVKQALDLPVLPRLLLFLQDNFSYLWRANPPFVIISAAAILLGALKRKLFPAVYAVVLWIPLLFLRSARQVGIYDPSEIIASLSLLSALLLTVNIARLLPRARWLVLAASILLLAAWNALQWFLLLQLAI